jgi:hypothetical protein
VLQSEISPQSLVIAAMKNGLRSRCKKRIIDGNSGEIDIPVQ